MYAYELIYFNRFGFIGLDKIKIYKGDLTSRETSSYSSAGKEYSDQYFCLESKKGQKKFKKVYMRKCDMYFDMLYEIDREKCFFDENIKNWRNCLSASQETLSHLEDQIRQFFFERLNSLKIKINIKLWFADFAELFRSVDYSSDSYDSYCDSLSFFGKKYSKKYYVKGEYI